MSNFLTGKSNFFLSHLSTFGAEHTPIMLKTRLHLALAQPSVSDARNQNPIRYHLANHQIALIYFGKIFSGGSQKIIAISDFLTKKSKKTKSEVTQNLCGKFPSF